MAAGNAIGDDAAGREEDATQFDVTTGAVDDARGAVAAVAAIIALLLAPLLDASIIGVNNTVVDSDDDDAANVDAAGCSNAANDDDDDDAAGVAGVVDAIVTAAGDDDDETSGCDNIGCCGSAILTDGRPPPDDGMGDANAMGRGKGSLTCGMVPDARADCHICDVAVGIVATIATALASSIDDGGNDGGCSAPVSERRLDCDCDDEPTERLPCGCCC